MSLFKRFYSKNLAKHLYFTSSEFALIVDFLVKSCPGKTDLFCNVMQLVSAIGYPLF